MKFAHGVQTQGYIFSPITPERLDKSLSGYYQKIKNKLEIKKCMKRNLFYFNAMRIKKSHANRKAIF